MKKVFLQPIYQSQTKINHYKGIDVKKEIIRYKKKEKLIKQEIMTKCNKDQAIRISKNKPNTNNSKLHESTRFKITTQPAINIKENKKEKHHQEQQQNQRNYSYIFDIDGKRNSNQSKQATGEVFSKEQKEVLFFSKTNPAFFQNPSNDNNAQNCTFHITKKVFDLNNNGYKTTNSFDNNNNNNFKEYSKYLVRKKKKIIKSLEKMFINEDNNICNNNNNSLNLKISEDKWANKQHDYKINKENEGEDDSDSKIYLRTMNNFTQEANKKKILEFLKQNCRDAYKRILYDKYGNKNNRVFQQYNQGDNYDGINTLRSSSHSELLCSKHYSPEISHQKQLSKQQKQMQMKTNKKIELESKGKRTTVRLIIEALKEKRQKV